MCLFLKWLFCGLAVLSLGACDSSGLVYAPVSDLTKPPVRVKPVRVVQHETGITSDAPVKDLAALKNESVGRLFVEKVEIGNPSPPLPYGHHPPQELAPHLLRGGERGFSRGEERSVETSKYPVPNNKIEEVKAAQPEAPVPTSEPAQTPAQPETPEITVPVASKDGWSWPTKGKVVSRFVANSITGNKGVDIQGALGQPVWAAAAGKVVYSGSGVRGYGNLIIIKHNQNYLSAYAYNQRLLVKEGDNVKGGQAIAEMGKAETGRVLLHFEIRYNGRPVDPLVYLK